MWISEPTMSELSLSPLFHLWREKVSHKYIETLPTILSSWRKKRLKKESPYSMKVNTIFKKIFLFLQITLRSFFIVFLAYFSWVLCHRISNKFVSIIRIINHALNIGKDVYERRVHGSTSCDKMSTQTLLFNLDFA